MIYFTADLHLGHGNIIKYCHRPFDDADHMDCALIQRWNEVVSPDDTVYVLGDLTMKGPSQCALYASRLAGTIRVVPGNHDRAWLKHPPSQIEILPSSFRYLVDDVTTLICQHEPIPALSPLAPFSTYLLHGHSHGQTRQLPPRTLDVGVDCHVYRPISLIEVMTILHRREDSNVR